MGVETIEYRPNKVLGVVLTTIHCVTAAVLVWVGFILGPDDVRAMDGTNRILFTVVPIWFFSWVAAVVFLLFAFMIGQRTFRNKPTLVISPDGMTIPLGKKVEWSELISAEAKDSELVLTLREQGNVSRSSSSRALLPRWLFSGAGNGQVVISSFALGADPVKVLEQLEFQRGDDLVSSDASS